MKVFYSKINSLRRPKYRIGTRIIEDNGKIYVEKYALTRDAISHINTIRENYEKLKCLYKEITILPYEDIKDGVIRFPYVYGNPINSFQKALEDEINEEYIRPFKMSEQFERVFPNCVPKEGEPSVSIANLDDVITNRISTKNGIVLFDYEWVFDFLIPISYLYYRRKYINNQANSNTNLNGNDDVMLFKQMEDCFQRYVNGDVYIGTYIKKGNSISDLLDKNSLLEAEHHNMLNSKSWRITSPLRKVSSIIN